MSVTAAPPASIVSNAASSVCTVSGRRSHTVTLVTTASVPDPTSAEQVRPGCRRARRPDERLAVGQNDSTPST
jgi:hypothetical protein